MLPWFLLLLFVVAYCFLWLFVIDCSCLRLFIRKIRPCPRAYFPTHISVVVKPNKIQNRHTSPLLKKTRPCAGTYFPTPFYDCCCSLLFGACYDVCCYLLYVVFYYWLLLLSLLLLLLLWFLLLLFVVVCCRFLLVAANCYLLPVTVFVVHRY